ncbi:glycosyltransferase family 4 protein [Streptomyces sp. NPDC091292]|uniref:glycosyltransferase family 4 protein n=1 Tax=Streptomyces sp. NPDC091292 TaxID=3365991 RepID=UPI0038250C9C
MPLPPRPRSPRPRVLHVVQPVDGGVARVVADLTRAHHATATDTDTGADGPYRIAVACPQDGPLSRAVRDLGADWYRWEATRSPGPSLAGEVRALARLVDAVRPDVVHAHSAKAGLAARLAVRGRRPTVFQPHAWSFEAVGGATARLALRWERAGARWASRVVCVSAAERATGIAAGIRADWAVVPNGVDTARFAPGDAATARATLPALDGTGDGPLVVCVARLCRQKGQDVLLRAWETVAAQVPGARLALVGDGPDARRLRTAAPAGVVFAGAAADAADWYRAADLVVLPSRWEGMALAPLEAMACARAVLVTDVDGARESLPPGHAPYSLVPPEEPGALARAAVGLLRDPGRLAALGRQGRRHVLTTHDVRHAADAVAAVYRGLLGTAHTECRESITS